MTPSPVPARGLASLRRLIKKPRQRCELCAGPIPQEGHQHLVDPATRHLLCVCHACAVLFDDSGVTNYRWVPRDSRKLDDFEIAGELWNAFSIPVSLVFFVRTSVPQGVMAIYPSPAGPTESPIDEDVWQMLASAHPSIAGLREDVEALLVNRTREPHQYFIVPVDECYKLTALIRRHWRGFSGGDDLWESVRVFFVELRARSRTERIGHHA